MQHTKTPWKVVCTDTQYGIPAMFEIEGNNGTVACINTVLEQGQSDAAHIVRCVNNFNALLAALNRIAIMPDNMIETARTVARAALAAAKAE